MSGYGAAGQSARRSAAEGYNSGKVRSSRYRSAAESHNRMKTQPKFSKAVYGYHDGVEYGGLVHNYGHINTTRNWAEGDSLPPAPQMRQVKRRRKSGGTGRLR